MHRCLRQLLLAFAAAVALPVWPAAHVQRKPHVHRKVHTQVGKASIYAKKFAGRKMADGERMDPNDANAASKTLPLGTRARVTNLDNGRSALVTIEDRGPHVPGRIVDLSPATAAQIGLTRKQGVARVAVTPVELPGEANVAQE